VSEAEIETTCKVSWATFICLRPLPKYARGTVDEGKGLMRSVGAGVLDRSNGKGGGRLEGKINENVQRRCTQSGDRGQGC